MVMPRPVYWSKVRKTGQKFEEQDTKYGKVYRVGKVDVEALRDALPVGEQVQVRVSRGGQTITLALDVAQRPTGRCG